MRRRPGRRSRKSCASTRASPPRRWTSSASSGCATTSGSSSRQRRRHPPWSLPSHSRWRRSWLRWVLSPEQLPAASDTLSGPAVLPNSYLGWLLGGEELRESNLQENSQAPRTCFLHRLHSTTLLPESLPTPRQHGTILDWIVAADSCPQLSAPVSRDHAGFLRRLLSPDVCSQFKEPPRRNSEGFLRWVISPESCPHVEDPPHR